MEWTSSCGNTQGSIAVVSSHEVTLLWLVIITDLQHTLYDWSKIGELTGVINSF
jgi:hypothetical protein